MPTFADLTVGDELPPLAKTPDREQLVKYAAGSGDFNPLHYDPEFPQARAIGDNIVHGRMKYASLGQLVSDWLAHDGWVRRIAVRYRGMDRRGETFTCRGRVADLRDEDGAPVVVLDVWTESASGEKTTAGEAEVVLKR
jgi:acyl dehydratase